MGQQRVPKGMEEQFCTLGQTNLVRAVWCVPCLLGYGTHESRQVAWWHIRVACVSYYSPIRVALESHVCRIRVASQSHVCRTRVGLKSH